MPRNSFIIKQPVEMLTTEIPLNQHLFIYLCVYYIYRKEVHFSQFIWSQRDQVCGMSNNCTKNAYVRIQYTSYECSLCTNVPCTNVPCTYTRTQYFQLHANVFLFCLHCLCLACSTCSKRSNNKTFRKMGREQERKVHDSSNKPLKC